jgi:hypothetical protein
MSSEATVYVQLLDENVDAWRPVRATFEGNGVYRLLDEQPGDERWAFPPGSRVLCQRRSLGDGDDDHLVARSLMSDVVRQAGEIGVTITGATRSGYVTTTELRLDSGEWPFEPVAPATLWAARDEPVTHLHKLLRLDGADATFESYGPQGEVPQPGGPYRMYSWFTPDQYEALTDTNVEWHRGVYEKPGDHTHCILTWEAIDDGDDGYRVEPGGGWISVDAYEKYIRDDILRVRRSQ